mgnify:CR=1 FL=1
MRDSTVHRRTKETDVTVTLELDGTGEADIDTGVGFLNHMLTLFAVHGHFDLTVRATGDLDVDCHHTVEDVALTLGEALRKALGDKVGIHRYGSMLLPMDEALAEVILGMPIYPVSALVFLIRKWGKIFFAPFLSKAG